MGWFWATNPAPVAPHPVSTPGAVPPPGCPMHKSSKPAPTSQSQPDSSCPVATTSAPSSCPVAPPSSSSSHDPSSSSSTASKLNPLNYMPSLSQSRAPNQRSTLPTSRDISSIPRGNSAEKWQYPSPQQMYNALLRKGYDDTPEDAIESMVAVHNFLNEGAWAEIVGWEARFAKGLWDGWSVCGLGEEEGDKEIERRVVTGETGWRKGDEPRLARFMGRPGEWTPKARMLEVMGQVWPARFAGEPPFDRHDWFVQRPTPNGQFKEVRYVIDYYSGPPEPTGEPVFYLDVRPAIDGPTAACERLMRWSGDVWFKASGGRARQLPATAEAS